MEALSSLNQSVIQERKLNSQNTQTTNPISQQTKTIDKKKLAVGVAAGIGISALVIGGLLYKHKIDSAKVKELAEHIEFKPAATLDEAINFGKQNLGIKKYKGFEDTDLDVINWINQGLTNINNVTKGKAIMPRKVSYKLLEGKEFEYTLATMDSCGELTINKAGINGTKDVVRKYVGIICDSPDEFFEKLDKKENFANWQNAYINIVNMQDSKIRSEIGKDVHTSTFSVINHEMGHLQHTKTTNLPLPDLEKGKYLELFDKSKNIAKSVSDYAATSPTEFVAECYSKMINEKLYGKSLLSEEARELYQKLGGAAI